MKKMENNAIFICFDDNYIDYAKAFFRSLLKNYPEYPQVLVLYQGVCSETIQWLAAIERLILLDPKALSINSDYFPAGPVNNKIVYQRFILWSELFSQYDKIAYLDVDSLILAPLDRMFIGDDFLAISNHCSLDFVRIFDPIYCEDNRLHALLRKDGITSFPNSMDDMANSGVFVIPRKYRQQKYFDELVRIATSYAPYIAYEDQSVISLWMLMNNIHISNDFGLNFQTSFFSEPSVSVHPAEIRLLHFSHYKPFSEEFYTWPLVQGYVDRLNALYEKYYLP